MNAFERYFHGEHGASRSYVFAKGFLLLLALDTWMLMLGHAGRYGVAGFNVAHFAWLDALLPLPTAAFYVGVLLLTGLLSLFVMLTGLRTGTGLVLFALYTLSWSMSMLDSYQHHYLVSSILFCLAFFPSTRAVDLHPLGEPARDGARSSPREEQLQRETQAEEQKGWMYWGAVMLALVVGVLFAGRGHVWTGVFLLAGGAAVATFVYEPARPPPRLTRGFGFALLGATMTIVYAYTAIAKMDENWIEGHTILRISAVEQVFAGLAALAARFGIERERFWGLFATFVIPQELFMSCAYLVAAQQERLRASWVRVVCGIAFVLAIALHVGAEAMRLEIGWFSYYMLLAAVCFMLPLAAVDRLATLLTWPARALQRELASRERVVPTLSAISGLALLGVAALALVGTLIDLPGALEACVLAGACVVARAFFLWLRAHVDPRRDLLASMLAAFMMWAAIALSPVRWDFYRFLGGDLSRRGELEAALEVYERGERYAPPGETRADKIESIKQKLERTK